MKTQGMNPEETNVLQGLAQIGPEADRLALEILDGYLKGEKPPAAVAVADAISYIARNGLLNEETADKLAQCLQGDNADTVILAALKAPRKNPDPSLFERLKEPIKQLALRTPDAVKGLGVQIGALNFIAKVYGPEEACAIAVRMKDRAPELEGLVDAYLKQVAATADGS